MSFLDADSLHEFIGPIAARFREEHGRLPNPRNEDELARFLDSFTVEEEESFLEFLESVGSWRGGRWPPSS